MPSRPALCLPLTRSPRIRRYGLLAATVLLLAAPAQAQTQTERWSVRLLAVKIGELTLGQAQSANRYSAVAHFKTTGVAGTLAKVRFDMRGKGRMDGTTFVPSTYSETMHTGQRQSETTLAFTAATLQQAQALRPHGIADIAALSGPLAAILNSLTSSEAPPSCAGARMVFDGARLTRLIWTGQTQTDESITCLGRYERIAGYTEKALQDADHFPISVTYQQVGAEWQAQRARVRSLYGKVSLHRRD